MSPMPTRAGCVHWWAPSGPNGRGWCRRSRDRIPDLPPSKATDPDSERYLLFAAAVGLLTEFSREQPVVLVLDDLQWADSGSLALLRQLTAAEPAMRVLVLGTFRDSELPQAPGLRETLGSLWRQQGVSRLELGGLDEPGVQALMEAAAGQPPRRIRGGPGRRGPP